MVRIIKDGAFVDQMELLLVRFVCMWGEQMNVEIKSTSIFLLLVKKNKEHFPYRMQMIFPHTFKDIWKRTLLLREMKHQLQWHCEKVQQLSVSWDQHISCVRIYILKTRK